MPAMPENQNPWSHKKGILEAYKAPGVKARSRSGHGAGKVVGSRRQERQ